MFLPAAGMSFSFHPGAAQMYLAAPSLVPWIPGQWHDQDTAAHQKLPPWEGVVP